MFNYDFAHARTRGRGMNTAVMFGKATDEWATPQDCFDRLDAEFGFVLDVAATRANRKCHEYLGPDHEFERFRDALSMVGWHHAPSGPCWMNPPYSKCLAFIARAAMEASCGVTTVALVPSRTDTRWWHAYVWDAEKHRPRAGVELRFIKGRLKFGNSENSAPFPSVVIVFRPPT
jgi:phage N-6-adenine-methyltransferase